MTRSSTHPFVQPLRFASGLGTVLVALLDWAERHRQRRALDALSDAGLKDIGLSRADVARERAKWPWER